MARVIVAMSDPPKCAQEEPDSGNAARFDHSEVGADQACPVKGADCTRENEEEPFDPIRSSLYQKLAAIAPITRASAQSNLSSRRFSNSMRSTPIIHMPRY